jgi:hypothetical protein
MEEQHDMDLLKIHEIASMEGTSSQNIAGTIARYKLPTIRIGYRVYMERRIWEQFRAERKAVVKVGYDNESSL